MKTEKEFITAVDELIDNLAKDPKLTEAAKVYAIVSLKVLKLDIKAAFKDLRVAKKIKDRV